MPARSISRHTNQARSSVIIQRSLGTPLNRLSRLQSLFGVPVAQSTLWKMVKECWERGGKSVFSALCETAKGGEIFSGDDTTARILEIQQRFKSGEKIRKGCYTSSICTQVDGREIILYFTANRYLSENFSGLFSQKNDGTVIALMIDASSNSEPNKEWVIVGYCIAHGRRKFVELLEFFRPECEHFLSMIVKIYQHDDFAKTKGMGADERMLYHREHSLPILRQMYRDMLQLLKEKRVEPNSRLGKVFSYWLKRRYRFAAFTRIPGMPLDNNGTERSLRPMAMGRKTSLHFMSLNSAEIWSGLFSIVYTCEKNEINAFAYLTWIQDNWRQVIKAPAQYLPWHFKMTTEFIAA